MTNPGEAITTIDSYEEIIKTQSKETKGHIAKKREMLKKLRDTEDFINKVVLIRSSMYFETGALQVF